ncbi:hypothetical protein U9M48_028045 [Paspalum notatum var. saurae]|uniref:Uncharacterized protein n=1 Tax=Paspalum notatum var. saurae TaxID=547442 RepID=A0AAQ3TVS0_PASNO
MPAPCPRPMEGRRCPALGLPRGRPATVAWASQAHRLALHRQHHAARTRGAAAVPARVSSTKRLKGCFAVRAPSSRREGPSMQRCAQRHRNALSTAD